MRLGKVRGHVSVQDTIYMLVGVSDNECAEWLSVVHNGGAGWFSNGMVQ